MAEVKTKLLIIGSGAAGYTAGIYAARAGLEPTLIAGIQIGGQLTITTEVENYPGFVQPIYGSQLMNNMKEQAERLGVNIIEDMITEADFLTTPFVCKSENNDVYVADAVIIATGASARWLDAKGEKDFMGFGVSGCATCDGFFYRGKDVAVIGGGNTALEEALYLSTLAKSVTLIHRRDTFRADNTMQQRVLDNPKISIEWNSVIDEFKGTDSPKGLTHIVMNNTKDNIKKELQVDGAFVAIGHNPNTAIFQNFLNINDDGYILTKSDSCKTNIEGVFAAGDVQDPIFRQAIVAAGSGCMAALEAEKYISSKNK